MAATPKHTAGNGVYRLVFVFWHEPAHRHTYPNRPLVQAKAVPENHAGGNGVDGEWNQLVSSHFEILDRDIQKLVTVNDKANEALLAELTWAVSREVFENLLECGGEATYVDRVNHNSRGGDTYIQFSLSEGTTRSGFPPRR